MRLETERLALRMPQLEDVDGLLETYGDPEVMRYIAGGDPWTRERTLRALERWLRYWDDDGFGLFVIEDADGRLLGRLRPLAVGQAGRGSTGSRKALRRARGDRDRLDARPCPLGPRLRDRGGTGDRRLGVRRARACRA